ncbi:succinate dehydrogenase, cytochrome b556 subunit [Sphingomonas sp. LY54]|uniref:succinate dehydrogenase, cytochrome b556 subunit n=1 Tax=Sphingomonadales TaxID=204457 RepID=UPI002ADEBBB2|nr:MULTISPECIES: succinate dehydrogenase, cytochrome b556 subunit [Sphingomonadales]MEA1014404.1 succinate dehydrogenase, cytochrome b556 subunit [Sphingosinicella sp. LY1275]WRP27508.1 succinate dehydrogenase, cytochrome b556 subunit [Sphingomonas sp. LY54]
MHRNASRPLSPHLTIWRWGPHMLVSILHRVTGTGLATVGAIAFVWWLAAAASGPEAYATFVDHADNWYGVIVGIGLTWAFWQHTASGLRHFVLDLGAGYELSTNKFWANMTLVASVLLTALTWFAILGVK